jgi:hypothetical protein
VSEHHLDASRRRVTYVQRPRIAASLPAPCVECRRPVLDSQRWHVGHIVSVAIATRMGWSREQINDPANLGPAHSQCKLKAGGRLGASISNAGTRRKARLLPW